MGSPGDLVNANYVNALPNRDGLFDIAAKLYGIKPETACCEIQLKREIFADSQLLEWLPDQLKATMNTRDTMGVLKCNLCQARALSLILRDGDGDEADRAETLEKLINLDTMRQGLRPMANANLNIGLVHPWNIAQWIAKFGVTVLSVVFPVAGVRAVATAANNEAGGVIGLLQPLVDSHLSGQQSSWEVEIDLTAKILNEACFIFHRVTSVRVLVEELQVKMGWLPEYAKFLAVTGEGDDLAASMVMDEIKSKAVELVDIIQNLEEEVDLSCEDLRIAALTLLQPVTDQVGNSQHVSIEIPTQ